MNKILEKSIVALLLVYMFTSIYFTIFDFRLPYWIEHFRLPNVFDFSYFIKWLLDVLSIVLIFIGAIQLIKIKKLVILTIFKFPIMLFLIANINWFITTLFSTEYSFFTMIPGSPWYYYVLRTLSLSLLLLLLVKYIGSDDVIVNMSKKSINVTKKARFFNWLFDLIIISSFGFYNAKTLFSGFIFEDVPYLNANPSWFIALCGFSYYFMLELMFLQTISKLRNNSFVSYKEKKTETIFIRTLCRLIPFDALSFLGNMGWHDSLSKTKVVKRNKD